MAKVALLIGISEYESDFSPLSAPVFDVQAFKEVLQHSEMGCFEHIKPLYNPTQQEMAVAIETFFTNYQKDDLVLLYFSGHGIKDESGKLYLATRSTQKNEKGGLVHATAVSASFIQDVLRTKCRSKRQVVILDCCFSGAFAEDMLVKDDGSVDVMNQLGGEGRAVLTSSTSTQYLHQLSC
jgi:branched-chain amino acid transport system substrate-binding protein